MVKDTIVESQRCAVPVHSAFDRGMLILWTGYIFFFLQYSTNALRKLRAKINSLNFRVGISDGLSLFKLRWHFHSSTVWHRL